MASEIPRLLVHLLLLRPLLHLVFGLNVRGRENLPAGGPFVIAANHNSHLDVLMLCAALPPRLLARTRVVAARDYFARHRGLFALVSFLMRPIWVDREAGGGDVLGEMGAVLDGGGGVIIFPEGTRGEAARLGRFHGGVGRLLLGRPDVPLLPAYLRGPERSLPRRTSWPLPLWQHLTIGPPQRLAGGGGEITEALRDSIIDLERSDTASRHRRKPERRRPLTVAVLGIDGSGKSTQSRLLAQRLSADRSTCLIGDGLELYADGAPREAQPLLKEKLRRWLGAQAKDARSLARYKIPKISELLLRDAMIGEARRWYGPDLILLDGSPLLNMTAWAGLYRPELMNADFCARAMGLLSGRRAGGRSLEADFPELKVMRRLGLTRLDLPDLALLVDVDPATSMARIETRGERKQAHETGEKLGRLREAYRLVMRAADGFPELEAHILDGEHALETVTAEATARVEAALAAKEDGT